jgi:rhamnogalacturonan endolyase
VDVAKGESWTKVVGPFLLYCNTGNNPQTIWADALLQQKKEAGKWPYEWVKAEAYANKEQRSTVSGRLVLKDPGMPAGGGMRNVRVGLSAPDYHVTTGRAAATNAPADITWQTDSKHYEFWVQGDNAGNFSIPNVRAGKYTLHAIADGVLGEFAKTEVTVEAGKALDLGSLEWTPVRKGKQVWEIGIPNRSGKEFAGGDDYFHDGQNLVYALKFPEDVRYTVGKSDFAKDWFYLQVPHATEGAIAAATVEARPRPARGAGGGFGRGAAGTQPGALAGRGGGAGTQAGNFGRGAAGGARGAGGGARGGGAPAAGGSRATPYTIVFDLPSAVKGKATLRLGIATANTRSIEVSVNGQEAGVVDRLATDSAIGRNGVQGIWFERELGFDAGMLKAGENTMTLTVPPGGGTAGVIYDYLRLEVAEGAGG